MNCSCITNGWTDTFLLQIKDIDCFIKNQLSFPIIQYPVYSIRFGTRHISSKFSGNHLDELRHCQGLK